MANNTIRKVGRFAAGAMDELTGVGAIKNRSKCSGTVCEGSSTPPRRYPVEPRAVKRQEEIGAAEVIGPMTPDRLIPEYLKKKHEQVEAEESQRQVTAAQQRADELLISNQWATFWKQVTEKLHLAVDSFPDLPYLKLDGKLIPFVKNQVRVEMHSTGGLRLNGTHTDLFCDGHAIHCTTLGDGVYTLKFCILSDTEIGVESSRSRGTGMDAEQASQYVIDRMMALLERQSR